MKQIPRTLNPAGLAADPGVPRPSGVALEVATILREAGVHAALGHLNARARFRFTGLFEVDPPLLRNVELFDRENPGLHQGGTVTSIDIGYCAITCATGQTFSTTNSRRDHRLEAHPARDSMIAYIGTPLRNTNGQPWGTLCHFDARPRVITHLERLVLEAAAPLFAVYVTPE